MKTLLPTYLPTQVQHWFGIKLAEPSWGFAGDISHVIHHEPTLLSVLPHPYHVTSTLVLVIDGVGGEDPSGA